MQHCFVIPVYNHPHYIEALVAHLDQFQMPIILVNDGSDVACTQLLHDIVLKHPRVDLVEHTHNQGKGQAVITGLRHAHKLGFSHALQLDADGQHDWQDVAKFLQISQQHPEAMVIGQPVFDASVPKKRLYGRYATHIWVWINSLSLDIKDSMCGFRVYPLAPTIQVLDSAKFQPRMGFDSEILVRLKWANVFFINVPTKVIYPEDGISHFNAWRDNWGMSQTHAKLLGGMLIRLPQLLRQKMQG
ncbi:glycosyl transferase [Acinetobacter sp. ANC 4218]|uniref:glycosyltransferase family 2 protein n=1 Tax=Acinetobacter sp. ANC 4218 TaxID=1977880 RepID=UPI000A33EFEB|nr:glycosyltransferase family 2 protein [Acinetobacter sp. ANC 4218]OTG73095.1 glycosyl transferase [Acinetobacter sp. ANC 4218]